MRMKRIVAMLLCLLMPWNSFPTSALAEVEAGNSVPGTEETPAVLAPAESASSICIKVDATGETLSIAVEPGDSIESIKAKVQDETGIPPERQALFYRNEELKDGTLPTDYDFSGEDSGDNVLTLYTRATVTYVVVGGTWADGTTEDKTEGVINGSSPASVPAGMIASPDYTGGAWDVDPASATIAEDTTFTYIFDALPTYTVTVNGGTGSDDYAEGASVVITAGDPEEGKQFKEWSGAEDLTFTEGSASSAEATFTMPAKAVTVIATYEDIPVTRYTVTYKVENGTWADGSAEDKTEGVESGSSPANVPTGMIASAGFTGGAWNVDPASATITGDTTFTYSFDADTAANATRDVAISNSTGYGLVNEIPASDGGYVWMGGDDPVCWHIVGQDGDHSLLISADVLGDAMSWDDAKAYCESVLSGLSAVEQDAVPITSKSEPEDYQYTANLSNYGPSTANGKLFLLSAEEADTYLGSDDARKPGNWWLRSPMQSSNYSVVERAGFVNDDGGVALCELGSGRQSKVRPAFQLDRASVLLESAAEGGKSSTSPGGGEFGSFLDGSGADRKLTLLDSSRSGFAASVANTEVASGGTLTVSYSGARTGENEYVSAMLSNADGSDTFYASLTPDSSGSGTWNMAIPEGLTEGSYSLKVFSEQLNGDHKTDYASPAKEFTLTVYASPSKALTLTVSASDTADVNDWQTLWIALSFEAIPVERIRLTGDVIGPNGGTPITLARSVTINLNGHTINRNRSSSSDNGNAFVVPNGVTLTIEDSSSGKTGKIAGGWATEGGSIYVAEGGTLNLNGGTITGNKAKDGGGVYVAKGGTLNLTGGNIAGNQATNKGGGVYAAGEMDMKGGRIADNVSDDDGGGIFVATNGTLVFDGGTISGNIAASDGGGICVCGTLTAQDAASGTSGGTIKDNEAEQTGGGVFVESTGQINLCGATVTGNISNVDGAGLNVHLSNLLGADDGHIRNCTITNNRTAGSGGGLRMTQAGKILEIQGTTIEGNKASEDGGGIYVREGIVVMGAEGGSSKISNNTAGSGGGGVNVKGGAIFNASDVTFEGNAALREEGGGMKNCGTAMLANCSFTGNTANTYGGGIYVKGSADKTSIKGAFRVTDNSGGFGNNVYLCDSQKLTCEGALTDSMIGVDLESGTGTITKGYGEHHLPMIEDQLSSRFSVAEGYDLGYKDKEVVILSGWEAVKDAIESTANNDTYHLRKSCAATPSDDRIQIDGNKSVTVDLHGNALNRNRSSITQYGQIFEVFGGSTLTIVDSSATESRPGSGKITGGWSNSGGGIYVHKGGTLNLNGGTITRNKSIDGSELIIQFGPAGFGGGVFLEEGATLNLANTGTICDNEADKNGGGVYVEKGATVSIKGNAVVQSNNAYSKGDNIYLPSNGKLTIVDALGDDARIGVTLADDWGVFTSGYTDKNSDKDPSLFFTSDDSFLVLKESDEAALCKDTFGATDDENPFIDGTTR